MMAVGRMHSFGLAMVPNQICWVLRYSGVLSIDARRHIFENVYITTSKVPNELGSLEPLRAYQGEDIEIQLPGSLTVYDIDWLSVWSATYHHNFGHVYIPKDLDVPPALGQTKISVSSLNNIRLAVVKGFN